MASSIMPKAIPSSSLPQMRPFLPSMYAQSFEWRDAAIISI